jgi:hypothetical protein
MATFTKFQDTVEQFWKGVHQLHAAGHTVKLALHSDAPTVATDDELADLTQVTGTGYTAGGEDIQNDSTRTGGTVTMTAVDTPWTATAGDWISGQYVSLHDDTSTTDRLICSYDYGAPFTLGNGETFTIDFGASVHTAA